MLQTSTVKDFNEFQRTWLGVMWSLVRIQSSRLRSSTEMLSFFAFGTVTYGSSQIVGGLEV